MYKISFVLMFFCCISFLCGRYKKALIFPTVHPVHICSYLTLTKLVNTLKKAFGGNFLYLHNSLGNWAENILVLLNWRRKLIYAFGFYYYYLIHPACQFMSLSKVMIDDWWMISTPASLFQILRWCKPVQHFI